MARAYAYAAGDGPSSREIETGQVLDRYGAQSVFGGPVPYNTMLRIATAENIVAAFKSRAAAENWAQWGNDNPEQHRLLARAKKAHEAS